MKAHNTTICIMPTKQSGFNMTCEYFSLTKDEVIESLRYHGEATFYINNQLTTYNNPENPALMTSVVGEMSLWQFNGGQRTIIFDTVGDALSFKLQDGKTIGESIESFKFEDFV